MKNPEPTPLQKELQELRATHGKVREFIIPLDEDDDEKVLTLFLRPVDMKIRDMADKLYGKKSQSEILIACLKTLRLGGGQVEEIIGNDYALASGIEGLIKYMKPADVVIKKN